MAAPDIDTIYQFESAIESAAESILDNAASITSHKQRDSGTLATPFAFCQLSGVQGIGKQYKTGTHAFNWPIDFNATLNVTVTTNRQENAASHATYLGKVRRHLYTLTNWTTQRLPYHSIALVQESGSSPQYVEDERFDQTTLSFRIIFTIRDDAWPS